MTEEAVEAPHAVMHREKTRQRASSRAWFAASLRLPDNLAAYDKFFATGQNADVFSVAWA